MFTFIRYEWKQWFRSPMLWIFFFIVALLIFGATSSDQISIGGGVGSVHKNAPIVVQQYYMVMSLICLLMTTAFMSATANRDFSTGMYQFVFTSPIKKSHYFFGSFTGAVTIAIIPMLGVSLGSLIGPHMPWADANRYGPVVWNGHLQGILAFAIPNTIIAGVLIYGLAVIFRNNIVSFVGSMLILVFYVVSGGYARDIKQEWLANLLDPFGARPLELMSKYMTVDEQNMQAIALTGDLLVNRLVWLGIAALILVAIYFRFSFAARTEKVRKGAKAEATEPTPASGAAPYVVPARGESRLRTFMHLVGFETKAIVRNQTFIIILVIGLINLIAALLSFTTMYGGTRYPVTYAVIDQIRNSFYLFIIGIITFYSGVAVWRERDARIAEIEDATPSSVGARFTAKFIALISSLFVVMGSTIVLGMIVQTFKGYTRYELSQYVTSLLVLDMAGFIFLVVIALLLHYLINNRYIAYFAFVAVVVLNSFLWGALDIRSNMVQFGELPNVIYSDMNGYGPFVLGQAWFITYWALAALVLSIVAYAFSVRGKEASLKQRLAVAGGRLRHRTALIGTALVLFLVCGGFVYYNTQVLNTYKTSDVQEDEQQDYELTYKKYQSLPQPKWTDLTYHLNIYPEERALYTLVHAKAVNASTEPISEVHFSIPENLDSMEITIPGAKLTLNDTRLFYRIYTLASPLQPGESLDITVKGRKVSRGFENEVSYTSLTHNGTFLNNTDIMPFFGYKSMFEITDHNERKKRGLPARKRMPTLDVTDTVARSRNYLDMDADLVNVRTIITTSEDQIAVAPGSLKREWRQDGRRCFEYQLDHPAWNFYSFISARYEVVREKWNGIDLEVYYSAEHAYNVPNMMKAMRKSLTYYTENFGPYYHKQCRIIEFPRYSSFAQAFPGTMPYSESIGFITDLREVYEDDIDFVFFVVSHEMGHQYWAHQLIGADMQGSEMMSESFAEYSALMVMEKEYGKEKMKKFLAYEMDQYLSGRSTEYEAERPLMKTEGQAYIHYYKGSVALYYLKEMIGEENMNKALSSLIKEFAYGKPPYPTSHDAYFAFKNVTPDSILYVLDDLLKGIIIFSNRVVDAKSTKSGDGYDVTFTTKSEKFRADGLGKENAIILKDYMDIGIFTDADGVSAPGKPLLTKRVKITKGENTFTFHVKEKPERVGIDPYNLLIDRLPDDNVKSVD